MPIEIRELVIRAVVENTGNENPGQGTDAGNTEKIVALCVDQVLEILKEKQER